MRLSERALPLVLVVSFLLKCSILVHGYAHPHGSSSNLNRRAMAGLWRLTGKQLKLPILETTSATRTTTKQPPYPMKEFTVYPKKPQHLSANVQQEAEFLLMLQEDGSFRQYGDRTELEEKVDKVRKEIGTLQQQQQLCGTWDYLDGNLILAADRPLNEQQKVPDTILVGKVVATNQESLVDHPASSTSSSTLSRQKQEKSQSDDAQDANQENHHLDTHLSVPKGSVEVGKFMYPKTHPSFFEQPMFQPKPTGSFELKQVLGSLNTQNPTLEEEVQEKFDKQVFVGKRFLLTSHPLEKRKPKKQLRWSLKLKKFVEDPHAHTPQTPDEEQSGVPIRVLELVFFGNNTFSTVAGLGSCTVLRGKWDVIGKEKDQFWMQVWRFGFGRSVSGSTFSEGAGLTQNDEKAYWGRIHYENDGEENDNNDVPTAEDTSTKEDDSEKRIEVKGSVLDGWGLEPEPVARFIMREATQEELLLEEEDEDDDEERLENLFSKQEKDKDDNQDIDWSNAFQ